MYVFIAWMLCAYLTKLLHDTACILPTRTLAYCNKQAVIPVSKQIVTMVKQLIFKSFLLPVFDFSECHWASIVLYVFEICDFVQQSYRVRTLRHWSESNKMDFRHWFFVALFTNSAMITTGDIIFPEAKDRRKVPSQIVRIVLLLSSLPFVSQ